MKITLNSDELYLDFPRTKPTKAGKNYNRYYISLNPYRNFNSFLESKIKKTFQKLLLDKLVEAKIKPFKSTSKIEVTYTIYNKTKARFDVSNQLCIIDKYFLDCLVVNNFLTDDSYEYVTKVSYVYGGTANEKKVTIEIEEV